VTRGPSGPLLNVELARALAATPAGLRVTVAGISMEPVAPKGTQVVVRAVEARRLRRGEVFLFATAGGEMELHRLVIALPGGWLVHRGDNQVVRGFAATRVERVVGRAEMARRPHRAVEVARALVWAAGRCYDRACTRSRATQRP